ncbi:MAG: signal peptidase [Solirubrobacteraceae bacterium]|nr:signal peptidase [Solirubrobacteraceae bacterium]
MGRAWARMLGVAVVVIALDQLTKQLVDHNIARGGSEDLILGIRIVNVRNTGVAFSSLQGAGPLIGVIVAIALIGLLWYFSRHATKSLVWLPTGMLLGGALGNVADRIREGGVIDFIKAVDFWPAFNVADISVTLGVILLLWVMERRNAPHRPA